jgi:hypothetical protein
MADIDIFCDESCHLLGDESNVMVLGAVYCQDKYKKDIVESLRKIKKTASFTRELKWSKLSYKYLDMYKRIIDYFFETNSLFFRAVVISNKKDLSFASENEYDDWYYKMYYTLLIYIISRSDVSFSIYLDQKDKRGNAKSQNLKKILCSAAHDDSRVQTIAEVDSQCNDLVQLADFFSGILSYYRRDLVSKEHADRAKTKVLEYVEKKVNLSKTASFGESKFNIFYWKGISRV